MKPGYLVALEGGGTRCQAVVVDWQGHLLGQGRGGDVNTNFVPFEDARNAVLLAVDKALLQAGIKGEQVGWLVSALVGPKFGAEVFSERLPVVQYRYLRESDIVFARAGIFRPHGVGVVAATGATAFAIRQDNGRQTAVGGWGALLGDEGSAYAMGLLGLRAAVRAFEGRLPQPTRLVEAVCDHYGIDRAAFQGQLVRLAYQPAISRMKVAGFAAQVSRLAQEGDTCAQAIVAKVIADLAALAVHAGKRLFTSDETFDIVIAGGLINAGELVTRPFTRTLAQAFPHAAVLTGTEDPAVASARRALFDLSTEGNHHVGQ
jgi:N-acetylglucosamine kinase-like BadF-type ATPase